jgi:hypothetical protein
MSVEIMGKVWGMALPHQQKMVLLSMADHADHEGKRIYPSLGLIAWKTDYSIRQVRRIVGQLVEQKILIKRRSLPGRPSSYDIDVEHAPMKPKYRQRLDSKVGHGDLGDDDDEVSNALQVNDIDKNLGHDDLGSSDLGSSDLGQHDLHLGHHVLPTPDIAMSYKPSLEPKIETKDIPPISPNSPEGPKRPSGGKLDEGFEQFWQAYPKSRHVKKGACIKIWKHLKPDQALLNNMLHTLEQQRASPDWRKDSGQFIPHPTTWLNQSRWGDEIITEIPDPSSTATKRQPKCGICSNEPMPNSSFCEYHGS